MNEIAELKAEVATLNERLKAESEGENSVHPMPKLNRHRKNCKAVIFDFITGKRI